MTDEEGVEFLDEAAMRTEALASARSILAGDVVEGVGINLGHFMAVRNDEGHEVYRLHVRDAVSIRDDPPEG